MNDSEGPVLPPPDSPGPWGFWATIGFFVLGSVAVIVAAIAFTVAYLALTGQLGAPPSAEALKSDGLFFALSAFVTLPFAALLAAGFAWLRRGYPTRDYLALRRAPTRQTLKWVGIALLLMACSDGLTSALGRPVVPPVLVDLYETPGAPIPLLIAVVLLAPVCEELVFRGFVFDGLGRSRLGPCGAVILTSVVWAAMHTQYDLYGFVTVFAVGILLGLARHRTGSVFPAILIHCVNNVVASAELLWVAHT